ncbi:MAG: hypothetical protein KF893_18950 [Caldilineaceae bacterium]|nr:hypothetical protein [Caldilineaceae bacterium]
MNQFTKAHEWEQRIWGVSLIAAPLLLALATLFWQDGRLGITGGTLQVYAYLFWIPAFMGLFYPLRQKMPRYATLGLLIAIYSCLAGNNFGMDGIYEQAYPVIASDDSRQAMGLSSLLVLFVPGALFPLSLLTVAIMLWRTRSVPVWVALLLAVGAIAFPISRIPRIELIAMISDIALIIPLIWLGWQYLRPAERITAVEIPT